MFTEGFALIYFINLCEYCVVLYRRLSSQVIDGLLLSEQLLTEIHSGVELWIGEGNRRPHLVAVLVGNDSASHTYVRNKMIAAEKTGKSIVFIQKSSFMSEVTSFYTIQVN